jgi:EmrB/QacA subfamily drug resistance transporter
VDDRRRKQLTLVLCCLAQFMIILDVSIVNVALPSIRRELGFSPTELQWIVSAYTLAFAGFLLLGGRAADLLGRREVFVAGLALFGLASLLGGLAQSEATMIGARALQGLGGAIAAPATLSILTTTFTEGAERNRALGLWGAMGGVGGAAGAVLGGVLTETLSWRWIFLVNVPVALLIALGALRVIVPALRDEDARRHFDVAGALTVTAGLVGLTYGIVSSEQHGWGDPQTLGALAAGVVLLGAFLVVESRLAARPLVPLRIFSSRPVSAANVVVFLMGSAAFAMWYFVSLYLQQVLRLDPLEAGLAFVPMTLMIFAFSQIASRTVSRVGPGPVLTFGMATLGGGMLLLAQVPPDGTWLGDVLVPSLLTAAGIGCSFVPVTIAATNGVRGQESGLASGLVNTSRQVGGSLGLALLATIATARTADLDNVSPARALTEGFDRAFAVGGGFALAGAVVALLLLVPRFDRPAPSEEPAPA